LFAAKDRVSVQPFVDRSLESPIEFNEGQARTIRHDKRIRRAERRDKTHGEPLKDDYYFLARKDRLTIS